jgi:hypothetical protein
MQSAVDLLSCSAFMELGGLKKRHSVDGRVRGPSRLRSGL